MNNMISRCPCCGDKLYISSYKCSACGVEIKNSFELSNFDTLDKDQYEFLITFLSSRGNLKTTQSALGISYPTAKKRLDELLVALEITEDSESDMEESVDMRKLFADRRSVKASEIIKAKLIECGGRVIVHTINGLPCEIVAHSDGKSFVSNKLPIKPPYEYRVFDTVVDLLIANGGRAKKGNGRNYKLGQPGCDLDTVVGAIAVNYRGQKPGESVFDPVFVLAAVLEWAGIVSNERGELVLTQTYREKL